MAKLLAGTRIYGNLTIDTYLSASGIAYASGGNSTEWNSVFSTVKSLSDSWEESAVISPLQTASADWNSVYSTTNFNSASWGSAYTSLKNNSARYESSYTTFNANSSNYVLDGGNTKNLFLSSFVIDFGTVVDRFSVGEADPNGNWWNYVTGAANNLQLKQSNNNQTTLGLVMSAWGGGGTALYNTPGTVYVPDANLNSGTFAFSGVTSDAAFFTATDNPRIILSGLPTGTVYDLVFYGSRFAGTTRFTTYYIGNTGSEYSVELQTSGPPLPAPGGANTNWNSSNVVTLCSVSPDSNNSIIINLIAFTGSNLTGTRTFGYLNALEIKAKKSQILSIGTTNRANVSLITNDIPRLNIDEFGKITITTSLSTNNTITSRGGNSDEWNSTYSSFRTNSANYILDGGNTKNTDILIGTNDNFNVAFETNGNRRLIISNTGSISGNNPTTSFNTGSATGINSFAANNSKAFGSYSFAEGYQNIASGEYSHAEGSGTQATAQFAHAEGANTIASGNASHAQNANTIASGMHSHAEGVFTKSLGNTSHSGGWYSVALHDRTWIWKGSTESNLVSTTRTDQFLVSAAGGVYFSGNVGIGTDANDQALTVIGTVSTNIHKSSNEWSSTYTTVNSNSGKYDSVYSTINANSGGWVTGTGVTNIVALTQAQYDALSPKLSTTLYIVT